MQTRFTKKNHSSEREKEIDGREREEAHSRNREIDGEREKRHTVEIER